MAASSTDVAEERTGSGAWRARATERIARRFWPLLITLVLAGLTRSYVSTRWDGFTIDEAWHVTAGVSYARTLDYRLNPEHPPLVKLWVGAALSEGVFTLPAFHTLTDKEGERAFINEAVYVANDSERVLARARLGMLAFHGLILVALGALLRRVFTPALALIALGLLLLDPTVTAHLPLVMTDLPVALLSACAMLSAYVAFRSWRAFDLALAALMLGLTLAAKHSGVLTGVAVAVLAAVLLVRGPRLPRLRTRLGGVLAVLLGAYLVLWSTYAFRFREAPDETYRAAAAATEPVLFNRPIADKIGDLRSDGQRAIVQLANAAQLLPRAYLWGLADILRVGVEGRYETLYVFGQRVEDNATPWYFFPAVLLAKLPLGLWGLALIGLGLVLRGRVPGSWRAPLGALAGMAAVYLFFLMRGNSGYAGVRHALCAVPVVALLAAFPLALALEAKRWQRFLSGALLAWALVSALPVMRPWEYYNELAGGADDAWRSFTDDGLDIRQRTRELSWYYDAHVRGSDERAYEFYDISIEERQGRKLEFRALADDPFDAETLSGTLFVNSRWLAPRPIYDYASLREGTPVARFGNLMVFRGEYRIPWLPAARRMDEAWEALYSEPKDSERAERLLSEAMALYPQDYGSSLELGNLLMARGDADGAMRAYRISREHAPPGDDIASVLERQIDALAQGQIANLAPIRNPWLE
ncbi:MAG: phospholipid carrier-dependent glycosyltransferase [Polyangiaceae bacterium]